MLGRAFISYSSVDGRDLAFRLYDALCAKAPGNPPWLDKKELNLGYDWDDQLVEGIRSCSCLLFLLTTESVESKSVCKLEWSRALKYKKPVVPLLAECDVEMPFRLGERQYCDFTRPFAEAV